MKRIMLRNLQLKDLDGMMEWMRDPVCKSCFRKNMAELTKEQVSHFITNHLSFTSESCDRHYAIVDEEDCYLGTISLKNIDTIDKNAEYAVSLRRVARGTCVAGEATTLLMEIAFDELGLEKVYLNVLARNGRAIGFYEKFGFREEGLFRKHVLIGNQYEDLKWYGLLKDEYKNRN